MRRYEGVACQEKGGKEAEVLGRTQYSKDMILVLQVVTKPVENTKMIQTSSQASLE